MFIVTIELRAMNLLASFYLLAMYKKLFIQK